MVEIAPISKIQMADFTPISKIHKNRLGNIKINFSYLKDLFKIRYLNN